MTELDDKADLLCVGGPHAGRWLNATGKRHVRVMKVTYERMGFHGNGQVFMVLVPVGTRADATLALLLAGYGQPVSGSHAA